MRQLNRKRQPPWLGVAALLAILCHWAPASGRVARGEAPVTVSVGTLRCFVVRCPDGSETAQERADWLQEVFVRHLGAARGDFAVRRAGPASDRLDILLNGERVISVTTNDARATGFRTTAQLAPIWKRALERAFSETQSQSGP